MIVRKIDPNNTKDVNKFIKLPFDLYRGNPYWVPPMFADMRKALDSRQHPFYEHSQAAFFLAENKGKTLGRIAILDNKRYRQNSGTETGLFYFFESVDNFEIAEALFEAGMSWAREQGIEALTGPKGLAQGDSLGMLVKGFDYTPAMGIAYNFDYYPKFMDRLGFEKESDLLSGFLNADDYRLPEKAHRLADKIKERRGFFVKQFSTKDELREWIPEVRTVYNAAFGNVPEFVPITEDEVWLIAEKILSIADPRLLKLVFKDDKLVGFLFAYPNISAGMKKARGRMWPLGWWHLMRDFKRTKWVDLNGIGLLPEHQGVGAGAILYTEMEKTIHDFGYELADFVQINELNRKSFAEATSAGIHWHKAHRIYKKEF
jgi:GNAT superfamily N-acetyltransferase